MDEQMTFEGFDDVEVSTDWKWCYADYPKEKNGLKVFSCFSCGGGSTMGYKLAGCDVIGNCEIDKTMNEIYVKNHHPKFNYLMDIRDFNKLNDLPDELYNLDILDGSPPCTVFSVSGLREEMWGKKKKFREGQAEQTLDDLSFVFIETVKKLKPKCVIMENVEGLLLGEAWAYVQRIYKQFNEAGYDVKHYLLKGEKMGIPQTRHRVFFVAFKKEFNFDYDLLDFHFNYKPITYAQIKEGKLRAIKKNSKTYSVIMRANDKDKSLGDTNERYEGKCSGRNTRYVRDNMVVPTIRAAAADPKDYNFGTNSASRVAYVCGMSVPPVMIKRIVNRIIETGIFKDGKENDRT